MSITDLIKGSPLTRLKGFVQELEEYAQKQEGIITVKNDQIQILNNDIAAARMEATQASNVADSITKALG